MNPSSPVAPIEKRPILGWRRITPMADWLGPRGIRPGSHSSTDSPYQSPAFEMARLRRLKRRARSVLFWTLGAYVLALLAANIILHLRYPGPFERLYRTKWDQLRQLARERDRSLIVMLGSSRTDGAFQAGRLNGVPGPDGRLLAAYNLGIPAAGPLHEYQYIRDMVDEGIRPRLLLVELLPPLLNQPHSHLISEEDWPVGDWMSFHQFTRMYPYFARPGHKANEWLAGRLAPWYMRRISLHSWLPIMLYGEENLKPVPYPHDSWGCRCPEELTPRQKFDCRVAARDYIPSLNHFRLGDGPVRAIHDLLTLCRDAGIPVALVLTPESNEFRSWYRPECLESMSHLLAQLRTAYGVEVIDASRWLDDGDFMDGHHLDSSGAAKFTARMSDEVQRLLR